jgi:MFS family permease
LTAPALAGRGSTGPYIALAGLFFGVNTAELLFLPAAARAAGLGSLGVGIVIAAFTGVGVLTDLPGGELANRRGVPAAMLVGCALTVAGTAFFLPGPQVWLILAGALVLGVGTSFLMNPILGGLSSLAGDRQLAWQLANVCVQRAGGLVAIIALTAGGEPGPVAPGAWAAVAGSAAIAVIAITLALRPARPAGPVARPAVPPGRLLASAVAVVRDSREAASGVALELVIPAMLVFGFSFLPQLREGVRGSLPAGAMLITREAAGLVVVTLAVLLLRPLRVSRIVCVTLAAGAVTMPLLTYSSSPAARLLAMGASGAVITVGILASNVHVYRGTTAATRMYGFALSGIVSRISGIVFSVLYGWSASTSARALVWAGCGTVVLAGALYAGLQSGRGEKVPVPGSSPRCAGPATQPPT